jgi:methionine synthase II (cobalamin-independent)
MGIKTTVIGSYPLSPNRQTLMKKYFGMQGTDPWKGIIHKVVNEMVTAKIDIVTDGQTRDPFIHLFTRHLNGCRIRGRVEIIDDISFDKPIIQSDQKFIKTFLPPSIKLKGVITGPYTLSKSCIDLHYKNEKNLAFAFAHSLLHEVKSLQGTVDVLGIDEPYFSVAYPEYGKDLINLIATKASIPIILHVCGDIVGIIPHLLEMKVDVLSHEFMARPHLLDILKEYSFPQSLCVGAVRSDNQQIESVTEIVTHVKKAITHFGEKILQISPDCGQRHLPHTIALKKLQNLSHAQSVINV